jgi:hypothetical protein
MITFAAYSSLPAKIGCLFFKELGINLRAEEMWE